MEDLNSLIQVSLDDEAQPDESMKPENRVTNPASIFGFGSLRKSLLTLYLAPDIIPVYWQIYKKNCDFLGKVLHIPTIELLFL